MSSAAAKAEDAPVVVELFTSQGCSSCPPADSFLTELAKRRDILPLSFHVTYWNNLGWKDPYSLDAATQRQREYAGLLDDDGIYTPQMIVDGVRGFVGSRRTAGLQEIARAAPKEVALRLTRDGDSLAVSIGPGASPGAARVLLVGYDAEHRTQVGRGENSGRTLLESNIVRSLTQIDMWNGSAMALRRAVPEGESFAVLLQAANGRIIGAARLENEGAGTTER
jgi:hypothetical protein